MSLRVIVPWLCAAAALAGAGGLYVSNSKLNTELAQVRAENQELQQFKAANENNANAAQGLNDELTRLRKDNEDLLRLRNEARQLRQEKDQLTAQLQRVQGQVQSVPAQGFPPAAQSRVWNAATGTLVTGATNLLTPEQLKAQAAFRARYGLAGQPLTADQMAVNTCINNLRQIDGAKQQWALENNKPANTLVSDVNITSYLPGKTMPTCPAGGTYTINAVGVVPTCSVPGHQLGK